jgi:hypothetical protein
MNTQENDTPTSIEDLPVNQSQQEEVKGGPANTYTGLTTVNQGILLIR